MYDRVQTFPVQLDNSTNTRKYVRVHTNHDTSIHTNSNDCKGIEAFHVYQLKQDTFTMVCFI